MSKVVTIEEAISHIEDGMSIMIGGFLSCGTPCKIIDALVDKGVKDLTIITNDTGYVDSGVGKLIVNKQVKTLYASHIGTNRETGNQMNSGELEVHLTPQGSLAEKIRAGGAGLGGVLTPVGLGTVIEQGKPRIEVDGELYLLEKPLKADVALLLGQKVDKKGNIVYGGSTRTFNTVMATAADLVIVEAENLVEVGEIDQSEVVTPGIFVDYIVGGDK